MVGGTDKRMIGHDETRWDISSLTHSNMVYDENHLGYEMTGEKW